MTRWIGATSAGLLVLSIVAGSAGAVTPVFVDGAGVCGGMAPCFTTIQAGVNNAGPPPAEVFIFPGTYAESVDLSTMGSVPGPTAQGDISLTSVNGAGVPTRDTATIDPGAGGGPGTGEAIFTSSPPFSGDVTLVGLRWTSPDADGVDINIDGNLVLSEVTGFGSTFDGADFTVSGTAVVQDSTFSGNGNDGIELITGGTVLIERSRADDNGDPDPIDDENDDGFDVRSAGDITMRHCDADRNAGAGVQLDERDDESISVLVEDTNCDFNRSDGLSINVPEQEGVNSDTGVTDVTCIRCGADDNSPDGIAIWAHGNVLVQRSHGHRNTKNGIQVNSDSDVPGQVNVTIEDSEGHRNELDGIKVGLNVIGDVVVRRSHAHFNEKDGFKLGLTTERTDSILVEDCTANDNDTVSEQGDGFTLVTQNTDDGSIVMERCSAERNGLIGEQGDGFQIWSVGDVTLRDCYAGANGNDGFKIRTDSAPQTVASGGTVTVERCVAEDNGDTPSTDDGFDFDWDGSIFIRDSTAIGNFGDGFQFTTINSSPMAVDIRRTRSNENGADSNGDGFDFEGGFAPISVVITDSEANGNKDDGVDMVGQGPITIRGFTANGNGTPGNEDDGVDIDAASEPITLEGITANGNIDDGVSVQAASPFTVVARFIHADGNGEDGVHMAPERAQVEMRDICVRVNGDEGIFVPRTGGPVSIERANAESNAAGGFCFQDIPGADVSGANISGNGDGMVLSGFAGTITAEQNFWGAVDGPAPTGSGDSVVDGNSGGGTGTIDFAPFSANTVDNGDPCAPPPDPEIESRPEPGDDEICGTARPNLGDECLEVCSRAPDGDECFGTGGTDDAGNFCIDLERPIAEAEVIFVRDVCSRTSSDPVVVTVPSPAPALSKVSLAACLAVLVAGAAIAIRRRRAASMEI